MSLLSSFRKNKQEAAAAPADNDEGVFQSRAQEESDVVRARGKRPKESSRTKQVDPMLPEKKRARRRLVGALALVLTMVIVLPMVLDSEPKPLADDIAIQIPSKDKPSEKRAAPASPSLPATAALDPNETVVQPPPPSSLAAGAPAAAVVAPKAKPESAADSAVANSGQKGDATKKEGEPKPKPVEKKAESRPEAKPEPVESKAKPEPKPAPVSAPTKTASKPAAEKGSEAARAQAILEGRGGEHPGSDKANTATESKPTRVVVQVAALAAQDKVHELQSKLSEAGIKSYTQKVSTQSGERIRVRVGPFASKEEADKMRARLQKLGISGTVVPS